MKQAISITGPPRPDVWAAWEHELLSQRDAKLATDLREREPAPNLRLSDYHGRLNALRRRCIGWPSVVGIALFLAPLFTTLQFADADADASPNIVVDTLVDEFDGDFGIGDVSLREAIKLVDEGGEISFAPGLANDDAGFGPGTIGLELGGLNIDKGLTIHGLGADRLTVDAQDRFRAFFIHDNDNSKSIEVFIHGITIRRGNATTFDGGAIRSVENLTISECIITDSVASFGAGVRNLGGELTVLSSTVANNSAIAPSGAFLPTGGGIENFDGTLMVVNSTVSGNTSAGGAGGISAGPGAITILNSTITNNTADADYDGSGEGGGVRVSPLALIEVQNTIIARNNEVTRSLIGSAGFPDVVGSFTSLGYNIIGDSSGSAGFIDGVNGDIVGDSTNPVDPYLEPLGQYGGRTLTHALKAGSPAVDAGNAFDCPPPVTDQRGINRPQGAACDIGAFEGVVGNVNDLVTFNPDPSSYESTRDATGCPTDHRGRYRFTAALANVSGLDLNSLSSKIDTLTGGNLALAPDGELLGVGDKLPVARVGDYADGILSPGEIIETPFEICLKRFRSFQFFVDVFGQPVDLVTSYFEGFDDDFDVGRSVPDGVDASRSTPFSDINEPRPSATGLLSLRDRAVEFGDTELGGGFPPLYNGGFGAILDFTDGRASYVTIRLPVPSGSTVAADSFIEFEVAAFGSDGGSLHKFFSTDGINFNQVGDDSDAVGVHRFDLPTGASDVYFRLQVGDGSIFEGVWIDNIRAVIRLN